MRGHFKDSLHILPHVKSFQHLVAFIKNEKLYVFYFQMLTSYQCESPARRSHHYCWLLFSKLFNLLLYRLATIKYLHSYFATVEVFSESVVFFLYLER